MTAATNTIKKLEGNKIGEARFLYRLFPKETASAGAMRTLLRQPQVLVSFLVFFIYLTITVFGYLDLLPDFQLRVGEGYEAPSWELAKIFGTDLFGRSVLYKLLIGAKTAMTIGLLVTLISVPVGLVVGATAGYFGGKIDQAIVWVYSVIVSVPYILLIIAISFVLGKGLLAICIAMGAVNWVGLCRLIRGEVMKHKNREYILAAKLQGANSRVIIFRHLLPNVIHLAIITASLTVLNAIKSEVILTYIGVGIPNGASWGSMIREAPGELVNGHWWSLAATTFVMFVISYALNIIGDALRDALDPRLLN